MIRVVALVAARDEADRVGATVKALRTIDGLAEVVVVDDGSTDDTAAAALSAGAAVLRIDRARGKGRALEGALGRLPAPDVWVLADADLAESAAALGEVMAPVLAGDADLAVGTFPPEQAGGFGLVKGAAKWAIEVVTGLEVREPLSGQRAITAEGLEAVRPLARGFGLETAMTIDAARAGLRVVEVPAALSHRATHRDARGFAHRGRQGWDILAAVLPRALGLR
jgi:glycosyltransferase involved in cell wall biosynthesis